MKNKLTLTLFALILVLSTVVIVSAQVEPAPKSPWRPRFNETNPQEIQDFERQIENYIKFRIVLSGVNMILYGYILYMYAMLYTETRSKFSLGLMALSAVLLIYSATSNPLLYTVLRDSKPVWISVFNSIPDVFASIAAVIMIYLTRT